MLPRHALRQASRTCLQQVAARQTASQVTLRCSRSLPSTSSGSHGKSWLPAFRLASSATSTSSATPASSAGEADSSQPSASSSRDQPAQNQEGSPDDRFSTAASEELLQAPGSSPSQPIGKIERRLSITFTCTVPDCGHRSSHEFSRLAYERGIVLCQCPACMTRHLIGQFMQPSSRRA